MLLSLITDYLNKPDRVYVIKALDDFLKHTNGYLNEKP